MKKSANRTLVVAIRLGLTVGAFMVAGAAFAQDAATSSDQKAPTTSSAKSLQAVTVTGSRIRGVDIETAQPVVTITQADIQKTGLISVGDILQNLTIAGTPTFSKSAVLASNTEEGGQYVNLYNLGENRTLVLVNGKRWMTSLAGFTDVSTIPASLIDHIDILKDGASAIYGSDAVAGVVNIILKDHYQGAEFNGSAGQNQGGDGTQQAYSVTFGTSTDKASLVFAATYNKTDAVLAKSRKLTQFAYGPDYGLAGLSGTGPWGHVTDNDGNGYTLNHTGGYSGTGTAGDSRDLSNYHAGTNNPDDYYNTNNETYYQIPTKLQSIFTQGSYNITDNITFKATGMFAERQSATQVAGYPLNTANLQEGLNPLVKLDGDSYYNPFPGQDVDVRRRPVEIPRLTKEDAKSFHFDAGFNGEFQVGAYPWDWDAGVDYNKYDVQTDGTGNLNLVNLQKALGPSFLNGSGVVQCGTAAAPIAASQCVPFDILGGPSASNAAALNFVNARESAQLQSISKDFTANITGGLFEMPMNAGTFSFAAGVEHRNISGFNHPDNLASQGYTTDLVTGATAGGYTTNEAYLEFNIPVLKDLPGVKALSFDVATRYSHYSNFGSTNNQKYSFQYEPIEDLKLRGTFAHGFRAPTISDLYGGGSQTFDNYTDPCDVNYGSRSNATVNANCVAAGLPANFQQTNQAGQPVTGPENQSSSPFYSSTGNINLKPETSTSRTVGLVYSPRFISGLDLTLDHYDIRIDNTITAISADYILGQCYQYSVQDFCSNFSRDPNTGQVVGLREGTTNLGLVRTKGYTFGANYRLPETPFGQFKLSFDANYLDAFEQQSDSTAQKVNYAGQWGTPKWRMNAGVDWQMGNWGASWDLRYFGSYLDQCFDATNHCDMPKYESKNWGYGTGADRIGVEVLNDVQGRYTLPWNASVSLGVRNLFNRTPPLTFNVTNNNGAYYDPTVDLTRYIYLQYNQKF